MIFKMDDVYSEGYAHLEYGISDKYDCWRFREEHFKVPKYCLNMHYKEEWPCGMAKIEDVRRLAISDRKNSPLITWDMINREAVELLNGQLRK